MLLSACSSEPNLIEQGKIVFNKTHLGDNKVMGCVLCHSTIENANSVGPSLYGLSQRTEKLTLNLSVREYIKQSIINPDAYIVDGYLPGVMFSHYSEELTETEIDALVEFIMHL